MGSWDPLNIGSRIGSPRVSSIINNKVGKAGTLMEYGWVGIEIVHSGRANNAKRHSVTLKELIVCACMRARTTELKS